MIRTIREELLDRVMVWNQLDLERKLSAFRVYYNRYRVHGGIDGIPPEEQGVHRQPSTLSLNDFHWVSHCHGLFELPAMA
ncbi:MAG: integrase core domain-containing protein [Sulfuricaulis sp.]